MLTERCPTTASAIVFFRERMQSSDIILVTHNLGVVADLCDRVAVMKDGEIVEQADVRELFADPQHGYTRLLIESVPTLRSAAAKRKANSCPAHFTSL